MATLPVVAVGCQDWGDDEIYDPVQHKFDSAGNVYPHGHRIACGPYHWAVYGIALDAQGNTYLGSRLKVYTVTAEQPNPYTLRKLNPDGDLLWGVNFQSPVHNLAFDAATGALYVTCDPVDAEGNLYTSGSRTGYATTRRYDNDGNLVWAADHGASPTSNDGARMPVAYRNGYVYTGGWWNSTTGNLTKYDADDGAIVWRTALNAVSVIHGITVDASDNVYIVGNLAGLYCLQKYDSSGALVASAPLEVRDNPPYYDKKQGLQVALDSAGKIIVATYGPYDVWDPGTGNFLYKYDTDCTKLADQAKIDVQYLYSPLGMALDADDNIYVVRKGPGGSYTWPVVGKFAADFSPVWGARTYDTANLSIIDPYCIAVRETEIPSLRIPLRLAVPEILGDRVTHAPGLPLSLGIGIPRVLRDYVGPPMPAVYRLELTGDADALPLPISSLQIRRNAVGIFIEAVIPAATGDTLTGIEARIDGDLVVYRGVRFLDGEEQLDVLVQVPLSNIRYDGGSNAASVTLQGQGDAETDAGGNGARTLRGISYRNNGNGRRRVRCAVDTYLRAGDTADLGAGETMTVGEIVCTISVSSAVMEVAEA